jgi:hypothetical protein
MKKTILLSLAIVGTIALTMSVGLARDEENGNKVEEQPDRILKLEDIQANPESYKATMLTFRGQFHRFNDVYSPFYTIFNSQSYLNFSMWNYQAPLWEKEQYKTDFPYLYVDKKDRELCEQMMELKQYTRVEFTGEVRSTFNSIPWIQVLSVKTLPRALSRNTIAHMARGFSFKKKGDNVNASLEFGKAWSNTAPYQVQYLIRKEEGRTLFIIGSYAEAVKALEHAVDILEDYLNGRDEETKFLLKEAYAMLDYEEKMTNQTWEEEEEEEAAEEEWVEEPEPEEEVVVEEKPQPKEEEAEEGETEEEDDW